MSQKTHPVVMVSSSVYGQEELLDRIYALLNRFGFEVWMSYKGTVPTNSNEETIYSCLRAVRNCDFFLGLITNDYGTSFHDGLSITHLEMKEAINIRKPRWFLVHEHVIFARKLLQALMYKNAKINREDLTLKENHVFSDLRIIDLYEEASEQFRVGKNVYVKWVQQYGQDEDAIRFATAQFSRFQDLESILESQIKNIRKAAKHKETR